MLTTTDTTTDTPESEIEEFAIWARSFNDACESYKEAERFEFEEALHDACGSLATEDAQAAMKAHLRDSRAAYLFGEIADDIRTNPTLYAARLIVREEWTPTELLRLAQELLDVVCGYVAPPPPPPPRPATKPEGS